MSHWLPALLPERVEIDGLVFVPLTPALVHADYAAVMHDIPMLRAWSGQDWPWAEFPLADNLADLQRHDREQQEGIALTYSVLLDGVVQGCIYVQPLPAALAARGLVSAHPPPGHDVAVRGWLHRRPAEHLVAASMGWLGAAPFRFPRLWWQTNSLCPEQVAACDALGLSASLQFDGGDRTWLLRAAPSHPAAP